MRFVALFYSGREVGCKKVLKSESVKERMNGICVRAGVGAVAIAARLNNEWAGAGPRAALLSASSPNIPATNTPHHRLIILLYLILAFTRAFARVNH